MADDMWSELPHSTREIRAFLLRAPTARLSDLLWRDWHEWLDLEPTTDTPFHAFDRRVMEMMEPSLFRTCEYVMEREIDPEDSLRIFIDTLLRFTGSRPYTRYIIVVVGLARAVRLAHAKMIIEFAKSVPPDEIYADDTPLHGFVARGQTRGLWLTAGAPAVRAHPSDPSLLMTSLPSTAPHSTPIGGEPR